MEWWRLFARSENVASVYGLCFELLGVFPLTLASFWSSCCFIETSWM